MSEALVDRLRGIYRIPITDWLGAVGSGEEPDNPNEFVRKFETAPIQHEAADRIEALEGERDKQREHIRAQAEDIMKLGHLVYDDADPPATWKMRALAAEADKARLSEALIGLCDWIENEVGAELPFDARAALSGSGSEWRVPDGWKLVPVEPYPEMIGAFWRQKNCGTQEVGEHGPNTDDYSAYRAMLAASPAAPQQGGE